MNKPLARLGFLSSSHLRLSALLLAGVTAIGFAVRGAGEPTVDRTDDVALSEAPASASCTVALAPHAGSSRLDVDIARAQALAADAGVLQLEALGWLFVAKARQSYDPGFYKLAEASADCALEIDSGSHAAKLLRGHVLYSMHRFAEAGAIAERLTTERETAFDFGLLGDVALSQGRTQDAIVAYQRMVDLKPNLQSYSRAAHIRWLKGDLDGANELMRMAAGAGTLRDPESQAWVWAQIATFELQAGNLDAAHEATAVALSAFPEHAPALLVRGRVHLARGEIAESVVALERAATLNPLPEYGWALADVLYLAGRDEAARRVETTIETRGPIDDPRTTSLYLSTRALAARQRDDGGDDSFGRLRDALLLAEREIEKRADVYTRDTVAWALAASGDVEGARDHMAGAVSEGTEDARLYLHAGVIAARAGNLGAADDWFRKAKAIEQMLLPSEQNVLERALESLREQALNSEGRRGTEVPRQERMQ